ncbi:Uma2 family endonuclease [Deinococcus marmoris]|uniref:Putative restriction endonuclease domain-containing protein n=1 Tax=Deinococcus marmoris TaxID=249408 RepID=A0A1U7P2I1_9DEIO|nr:Uma2 family endonuclease [Deinococcus marmoris]OLV19368.1 hypothetical protein BOO71_0002860 [Deinococcus marmoris]
MSDPALRLLTEQDYLASEELSPVRREYVDGFVYAQAGASRTHGRVASNILRVLLNATEGGPCWVYASDMKVKLRRAGGLRYYYPDLVVVCDEDNTETHAETRPCLIVEILSRSTRQVDMTFKAQDYLSLPSLQGYLLVDSEAQAAELYRRLPGGGWTQETVQDTLTLPCVNVALSLAEIYAGVRVEPAVEE